MTTMTKPKKTYPKRDHSELLTQLQDGISELTTSSKWTEYLTSQARFHRYSAGNCLLIMLQDPYATRVAGFNTWKAQGRNVRKGEKGIFILAPLAFKTTDEATGEESFGIKGFRYVAVFDVAQTEGDDLPTVADKLVGDDPDDLFGRLVSFANSIGFTVADYEFESGVNGDCNHLESLIRIHTLNSGIQRVKTLAHELGHAILHSPKTTDYRSNRGLCELEAESVAFVVLKALGVDSDTYSFGYVAGWGDGDAAVKTIKASQDRIQKTSKQILDSFVGEEVL